MPLQVEYLGAARWRSRRLPPDRARRRAGRPPTIFAMGGGGFAMEPDNPALDDYVLGLAPAREPRICLLPTAGGDAEDQIRRFYAAFGDAAVEPTHISLFRLGRAAGGRSASTCSPRTSSTWAAAAWSTCSRSGARTGVDAILREAWRAGVVLAGLSAGSMCWFEAGDHDLERAAGAGAGLGLLPARSSVHYDGEPERRPFYLEAVAARPRPAGYGIDDDAGLLFRGTRLVEVVASRPRERGARVSGVAVAAGRAGRSRTPTRRRAAAQRRRSATPEDPPPRIAGGLRRAAPGASRDRARPRPDRQPDRRQAAGRHAPRGARARAPLARLRRDEPGEEAARRRIRARPRPARACRSAIR